MFTLLFSLLCASRKRSLYFDLYIRYLLRVLTSALSLSNIHSCFHTSVSHCDNLPYNKWPCSPSAVKCIVWSFHSVCMSERARCAIMRVCIECLTSVFVCGWVCWFVIQLECIIVCSAGPVQHLPCASLRLCALCKSGISTLAEKWEYVCFCICVRVKAALSGSKAGLDWWLWAGVVAEEVFGVKVK